MEDDILLVSEKNSGGFDRNSPPSKNASTSPATAENLTSPRRPLAVGPVVASPRQRVAMTARGPGAVRTTT